MLETTEDAKTIVKHDSILPLDIGNNSEEKKTGWALRRNERSGLLDIEVKKEVENLVRTQLNEGRRAEAQEIRDKLREAKLQDGSYKFSLEICLSESQIKSQITRVLNLMKKEKEISERENQEQTDGEVCSPMKV